ncbi:MAG TPA: hypothetical protein VM864_11070 [Pyrinomonadaceae bacterium]|jgi:hypothetical protein|nr:hypothetical protein [Pyrinomonadaceae bacterium]
MRSVLRNLEPPKNLAINLKSAALISLILVLPFAILEALNNTITGQNAPGVIILFGLLWLMPTAFILILVSVVRAVRDGNSVMAHPASLLLRVAFLALIAMMWGGILTDQMPCLMGVPNCD